MKDWSQAQVFVDRQSSASSVASRGEYDLVFAGSGGLSTTKALTVELTALGAGATGNAMVVDDRTGAVSACAMFVDSVFRNEVLSSVDVAFPAVLGFSHRWAMSNAEKFEAPADRFERRPSQYYWLGFALVFMALWTLSLRNRRSDYALYAILGLRRTKIATLAVIELLAILLFGWVCFLAVSTLKVAFWNTPVRFTRTGFASAARNAIAMCLLGIVGCWYVAGRTAASAVEAIKDR
jgi:hypothetical protein